MGLGRLLERGRRRTTGSRGFSRDGHPHTHSSPPPPRGLPARPGCQSPPRRSRARGSSLRRRLSPALPDPSPGVTGPIHKGQPWPRGRGNPGPGKGSRGPARAGGLGGLPAAPPTLPRAVAVGAVTGAAAPPAAVSSSRFPVELPSRARVIARDLPSKLLTHSGARPHLRSLSPEPHRPSPLGAHKSPGPRALGGGGTPGWAGLFPRRRAGGIRGSLQRARGPPGVGTATGRGLAQGMPTRVHRRAGSGGARRRTPPAGPPPQRASRGSKHRGLSVLTQGDSTCRQSCRSHNRQLLSFGAPLERCFGLSWGTRPARAEPWI